MNNKLKTFFLLVIMFFIVRPSYAEWITVGTGIEYQKFTLPTSNNVYVARMQRSNLTATIDSTIPQNKLTGARETVKNQAERFDDAINWWGKRWGRRNDVVVAINGDWINLANSIIYGGQVQSGWYAKQIYCEFGGSQFIWTNNRLAFIGGTIGDATQELTIKFKLNRVNLAVNGINRKRTDNGLIIYTPQYHRDTNTDNSGVEVLVEMPKPLGLGETIGLVRSISKNKGSTPIPFDHIVLSATGDIANQLLSNMFVGDRVEFNQNVFVRGIPKFDWSDVYTSISGGHVLLKNGVVIDNTYDKIQASRQPRTSAAYNDKYIFFVVCDGRSKESFGMTGKELAGFIKDTLGANNALNLDGGGSSTMVVNGSVVNVPSDGKERSIGNCLMMINLKPELKSSKYSLKKRVTTSEKTNLRLGPGDNYGLMEVIESGCVGNIKIHNLNGIFAKGNYWWKVKFGENVGWVSEDVFVH